MDKVLQTNVTIPDQARKAGTSRGAMNRIREAEEHGRSADGSRSEGEEAVNCSRHTKEGEMTWRITQHRFVS